MIPWTRLSIIDDLGCVCFWEPQKERPATIKTASYFERRAALALLYWATRESLPEGWTWHETAPIDEVDWSGIVRAAKPDWRSKK